MFKYLKIGEVLALDKVLLIGGGLAGFLFGGLNQTVKFLKIIFSVQAHMFLKKCKSECEVKRYEKQIYPLHSFVFYK